MDYIKFNCYDIAEQDTELYNAYSKIQMLSEELESVISTLDPQINSYENLQHQLAAVQSSTADISLRIFTSYKTLDQIIDLYYAAENRVKQTIEELPGGAIKATGNTISKGIKKVQTSSINRGDLILEDWLAELIYKDDVKNKE